MKRWIVLISSIIIVIGAIWAIYVKHPRTIDVKLNGVKYQLGYEGAKSGIEPATVIIQGKVHTSMKGERIFKGTVRIVGEQIPVPQDQRNIEIHFFRDGWGSIAYPIFLSDERGVTVGVDTYQSHTIFANKDFSEVTFLIVTPPDRQQSEFEEGYSQSGWNSDNGKMLSAPASTREEALALSNKMMLEFLKPYGKPLQ